MIEVEDKDPKRAADLHVSENAVNEGNIEVMQPTLRNTVVFHKDTWPALKAAIEATIEEMEKPKEVTIRLLDVRDNEPFTLGGQSYRLLSTTQDSEGYLKVDARNHTRYVSKLFRSEQVTVIR